MKRARKALVLVLMMAAMLLGLFVSVSAAEVKMNKSSVELYTSQKTTLKVTGTKKKAKWSSSNKKVATVDSKGKVTAKKAGNAVIKAKIGKVTCSCTVKVKSPSLNAKTLTLYPKGKYTLKLSGARIKSVTSSKSAIAAVTKKGVITAKKIGTCKITVKDTNGRKYTCTVNVVKAPILVNQVTVSKSTLALKIGETGTLVASVTPFEATNKSIAWTSSNPAAAKVSLNGTVTAVAAGQAVITASATDGSGKSASCTVTVSPIKATGITLNKTTLSLYTGEVSQLTASIAPGNATNNAVSWSSSSAAVAEVNASGRVTAKKAGTAVITASAQDGSGVKASCTVTVLQKVTNVEVKLDGQTASEITLEKNQTANLTAQVLPADASNKAVKWSSSAADVAAVDQNGTVTVQNKTGEALITAEAADGSGAKAVCKVTVIQKAQSIRMISDDILLDKVGDTAEISAEILPADTTNKHLNWMSDSEAVKVEESGEGKAVVTAVSAGTAKLTAVTADGTGLSCRVAVSVAGDTADEAVVIDQASLDEAMGNTDLKRITIQTNTQVNLTIPEAELTDTELLVIAPNAEIVNNARFSRIVIRAIADNTFIEQAVGNTIICEAASGKIEIAEGASAEVKIEANDKETVPEVTLVNNGTITNLTVDTQADLTVTGAQNNTAIPVAVTEAAKDSSIVTGRKLDLTADAKIDLKLESGAEGTTAAVSSEENIPDVSGLGSVTVKDSETGEIIDTVVAENTSGEDSGETSRKIQVNGRVVNAENAGMGDVDLYLVAYSRDLTDAELERMIREGEVEPKTQTSSEEDSTGNYSFETGIGNYYLLAKIKGYKLSKQTLVLTSVLTTEYTNAPIAVTEEEAATGSVSGQLNDAATGKPIEFAVRLRVRSGFNNQSGAALLEIEVPAEANGAFLLEDLEAGAYTIQILKGADSDAAILATTMNVNVVSGTTITEEKTITRSLEKNQVRFVLSWGSEASGAPSDLDSHLVGPDGNGGKFHTYFSQKNYYQDGQYDDGERDELPMAGLDVDDTEWEGPETTTIYNKESGSYSFYVYDYTDQSDENSTNMSNKSAAVAEVYVDGALQNTFYIPTGQSGNLWHVCDYDAGSGNITYVNTVGYWPDAGSATVGLSAMDVLKLTLQDNLNELKEKLDLLAEGSYKESIIKLTADSESFYQSITEETEESEIQDVISEIKDRLKEIRNAGYLDSISGENVLMYDINGSRVDITGFREELGEITVHAYDYDDESVETEITDVDGKDYVKTITVTDSEKGITLIWYVYYQKDVNLLFDIRHVEGEQIYSYEVLREEKLLEIYGYSRSLPEFSLNLREGVSWELNDAEDGSQQILLKYADGEEEHEYKYQVRYEQTRWSAEITKVSGDGIFRYFCTYDDNNDTGLLTIYGLSASMPEYTLETRGETTIIDPAEDEDGTYIKVSYNGGSILYTVKYIAISNGTPLDLNQEVEVSLDDETPMILFAFTPAETGSYEFSSSDYSGDPKGYLYQGTTLIAENDDGDEENNFVIRAELEEGVEYLLGAGKIDSDNTASYKVKVVRDLSAWREELANSVYELQMKLDLLAEGSYKDSIRNLIDEAYDLRDKSTEQEELETEIAVVNSRINEIEESAYLSDLSGENVSTYYFAGQNQIYVTGAAEEIGDISVNVYSDDSDDISADIRDAENEEYVKTITAGNKENGPVRIWYVYYQKDPAVYFMIDSVEADGIWSFNQVREAEVGTLFISGLTRNIPEISIVPRFKDKVTWSYEQTGDTSGQIQMEYRDEDTVYQYLYQVVYEQNAEYASQVRSVSGENVYGFSHAYDREDVIRDDENDFIIITGFGEEIPEYSVVTEGDIDDIIYADDRSSFQVICGGHTLTYKVEYNNLGSLTALELDKEESVSLSSERYVTVFTFTPEKSAVYEFTSLTDESDPYADPVVYLKQGEEFLTAADDGGDGSNFRLIYELQAGVTYTFEARENGDKSTSLYKVKLTEYMTLESELETENLTGSSVDEELSLKLNVEEEAQTEAAVSETDPEVQTESETEVSGDAADSAEEPEILEMELDLGAELAEESAAEVEIQSDETADEAEADMILEE